MSDKKEIVSASPKVRKLAREFGANIYQIEGSLREGRVSEEDIKSYIKNSISKKIEKKYPNINSKFIFINSGFNLRPTDIIASIGNSQFKRLLQQKDNTDNTCFFLTYFSWLIILYIFLKTLQRKLP